MTVTETVTRTTHYHDVGGSTSNPPTTHYHGHPQNGNDSSVYSKLGTYPSEADYSKGAQVTQHRGADGKVWQYVTPSEDPMHRARSLSPAQGETGFDGWTGRTSKN